ncbi:23S rRNA (adenine(1618)-N(6))-methyltransferase RlmF [Maribacter antarcticus]|uniref:23S rRNA (adenine(1618)-N(6))-methyltransferase RlmF n=1 Tax=Maribacter antarcticus TaxID=505250 RepID=UPI00047DD03E|nr:23S rRNA (adenine(1618)-N(6))-methyltransferase RlmF [Maribacter antarcticus]
MPPEKKEQLNPRLHLRNRNRDRYDLKALIIAVPELEKHVSPNSFGVISIDFSNPIAVKLLNKALLNHYYGLMKWEFPDENLCPPIPGRADYIHHIADLLSEDYNKIPIGNKITGLDIGVGASCIYPIIGVTEYGWRFIGTDIDAESIASARHISNANESLKGKVDYRLQKDPIHIFEGVLNKEDKIDITLCNPPFHASMEEAQKGTRRKIKNLSGKKVKKPALNFAGVNTELVYDGGEYQFIQNMIRDSVQFSKSCFWFSTLVSKESHLKGIYKLLKTADATVFKTISTGTGNKSSRIVAWTFLSKKEQATWREKRW